MTGAGSVRVRPADEADLHRVMALVRTTPYLQCHTEHTYWILLRYGRRYTYVAETSEALLGYASGVRSNVSPELFFLWQMVVAEHHRRSGIAMALLQALTATAAADGCDEFHAAVAADNHQALGLLERWASQTGRTMEAGQEIVYTADDGPSAEPRTVTEQLTIIRSAGGHS